MPDVESRSLISSVEALGKVTGVIAVLGYLSLRSHLNFLGISSQTILPVERYLAELSQFIVALVLNTDVIIFGPFLFAISAAIWRWRPRKFVDSGLNWVRSNLHWILSLFGCVMLIWVGHTLTVAGTSNVVGDLSHAAGAISSRESNRIIFHLLCFICVSIAVLLHSTSKDEMGRLAWWSAALVALMLFVQLPLTFGSLVRPTHYAKVALKEDGSCALLLLDKGQSIAVWRTNGTIGWVDVFEKATVKILGTADVLVEAAASHSTGQPRPSCKELETRP